jgi:methylated-DNA-[protein]-cysteine S-methyltransferase
MLCYDSYQSPQGRIYLVATERGLRGLYFAGQRHFPRDRKTWARAPRNPVLRQAKRELREYFAGRRRSFSVPLDPAGTAFQRSVWRAMAKVGYGRTVSYGQLAGRSGHRGSARATGAAVGRNPVSIILPCHRIVGANGALTGYAGGLSRKRKLLELEGAGRLPGR